MKKLVMGCAIVIMIAGTALASKPIQVSIIPDVALYGRTETIEGLTLGLWSENPQTALALGIVNGSTGQSAGLSWAFLLNYAENYRAFTGLRSTTHPVNSWAGKRAS